jgi:hypothetical protein
MLLPGLDDMEYRLIQWFSVLKNETEFSHISTIPVYVEVLIT